MARSDGARDHEAAVGTVIIVALVGFVALALLLVVGAGAGLAVYLLAARSQPPPPTAWQPTVMVEPTTPAELPVSSPLLDATAELHMAGSGVDWAAYGQAVAAVDSGTLGQARELIAALGEVPERSAAREELDLLGLAAAVDERPTGTLALDILAWRERYPDSRLTRYSLLVDGQNCVQDARRQDSAAGAAADAGDVTLAFCTIQLTDLSRFTASDPYVSGIALYELGYAHRNLEQTDEALQAWQRLAEEVPTHPRAPKALYDAGNLAWGVERHDEAAALFGALAERYPDDPKAKTATYNQRAVEMVGRPAPELVVDHWLGTPSTLAEHRGEVVVLLFWNEWCDHCHSQFPWGQELRDRYGEQGLTVLLVTKHTKEQTDEKVAAFLDANATTLPCAVEPESRQTTADYAVYGVPTAAVVGRDGTVLWRNHPIKLTDAKLEELLAR